MSDDDADKKARELADHCRYCGMPDYRPKCKQDYEDSVRDIAAALREAEAKAHDDWGTALDKAEDEIARLKAVGGLMANLCFNGMQNEEVPLSYREDMRKLQKEWDAILNENKVRF